MKAIRVSEYGGPSVLKLEEVPTPQPGPNQVLVRILADRRAACSVRPAVEAGNALVRGPVASYAGTKKQRDRAVYKRTIANWGDAKLSDYAVGSSSR